MQARVIGYRMESGRSPIKRMSMRPVVRLAYRYSSLHTSVYTIRAKSEERF